MKTVPLSGILSCLLALDVSTLQWLSYSITPGDAWKLPEKSSLVLSPASVLIMDWFKTVKELNQSRPGAMQATYTVFAVSRQLGSAVSICQLSSPRLAKATLIMPALSDYLKACSCSANMLAL